MKCEGHSKQKKIAEEVLKHRKNVKVAAQAFTFRELAGSADNFDPDLLIGEGALGRVYKGHLRGTNQVVAMKQLDMNSTQGNREFLAEVMTLSLVDHPNLVSLLGYCADGNQRILVYEFMSNGSLESHLLNLSPEKEPLDWYTRMKIAKGAAQGLEYLHDTANPPVIYRDFKTSNILLDDSFNPKLSDFGLAKLGPVTGDDHATTRVLGTYGYSAPEYVETGQLTSRSDVYSFGVVLLEIISGRRAIDNTRPTDEQYLVSWAKQYVGNKSKSDMLADPLLEGNYPAKGLYQAIAVAGMCLQEEASTRPLIRDVVVALEYLSTELEEHIEEMETMSES